jgi:hypothetical protein
VAGLVQLLSTVEMPIKSKAGQQMKRPAAAPLPIVQISTEEALAVGVDEESDKHFVCRICAALPDAPSRFGKGYALKHFTNEHADHDRDRVKGWVVVKDGNKITNNSGVPLLLTTAIQQRIASAQGSDAVEPAVASPHNRTNQNKRQPRMGKKGEQDATGDCDTDEEEVDAVPKTAAATKPRPEYTADTDISGGIKCYYPECTYVGQSWLLLCNHAKGRCHQAKVADYEGTYMHMQYNLENNAMRTNKRAEQQMIKNGEQNKIGNGDKEEEEVDGAGALGAGSSSSLAFIAPAFLLCMPGGEVGNRCLVPDSALTALLASGFVILDEDAKYRWNDIVPVDMQWEQLLGVMPPGAQREAIAKKLSVSALGAKPKQLARPPGPKDVLSQGLPIATPVEKEAETKGPGETKAESKGSLVACIAKECRSYTRPSEQQLEESFLTRRRFAWPCESQSLVELQEVLDFVRRTTKTKGSRDILDRGMRYFFEIFEFSDERQATLEKVDVKEAFKVLYDRKLIHKAIGLDLLHESISWTRCINEALEKLCDFLMMAYEDDEDDRGMRIAGACKVRVVEPLKKKVNAERAKQTERRKKIDAIRMGNILPVSSQNDVAKQSMWDMKVVRDAYIEEFKKKGTVPQLVRRCLNTQAYGVSAYRAYPGRPGEWKRMTKGMIEECVNDENRWYVVITDHKTFKSSGALGRYIPDDVKFVFRILLEFAPPESKYLYQSPSGGCVEIHRLALEHGLMYSPKFEVPEPTLMRKYVETMVADKQNKDKAARMIEMAEAHAPSEANQAAAKMAAKFSGHSFSTGGKYYNLNANDPEEHAYASKAYIECFVGPVLDSPEPPANTQRTAAGYCQEN